MQPQSPQPLNASPQGHRRQERVLGFGGFDRTYRALTTPVAIVATRGTALSFVLGRPADIFLSNPFPLDERHRWPNSIVYPSRF